MFVKILINQLILLGYLREKDENRYEDFRQKHGLYKRFYLNAKDVACYFFHEYNDSQVKIEKLEIDENGLPLATFFSIVRDLTNFDDELAIALNPDKYAYDK